MKMKNSSSFAHDRIDAKTIKLTCDILIRQITYVVNLSIKSAKFINKWRIGKVVPLFNGKSASPLDPKGFRPISLLPVLSKLAECVVQKQIVEHFDNNGLWNKNQHGYRNGRSTTSTLLQISDLLFEAAGRKRHC